MERRLSGRASPREGAFAQGVASGEPAHRRDHALDAPGGRERPGNVGSRSRAIRLREVVSSGTAVADAAADFTVHQRVSGVLAPGEEYYYRFSTARPRRPSGASAPPVRPARRETVRIAFFSCQEFIAGFYAAHRDLAAQDVDLVVCLGDYIYEQAFARRARPTRRSATTTRRADGEAQTLAEYRRKYSLYHTDANLLEVRRQFALVGEWDDHEVEDNYAGGLPGGAAKSRRVPFAERRANGYRAWFEHMPRRLTRRSRRSTARCRWATPSCSCSTRASTATTSRATRRTPRSRRRARRRRPTTRRARCSAPSRRRG